MDTQQAEASSLLHGAEPDREEVTFSLIPAAATSSGQMLVQAVWLNEIAHVRRLLEDGIPAETRSLNGDSLLHIAAQRGDAVMITLLLQYGLDPLRAGDLGTPLHRAASAGNVSTVRALLETGMSADITDEEKNTPLHRVAWVTLVRPERAGFTDHARLLLDHGANPNAVNRYGIRPLHEAARRGATGIVRLLLDAGAAVDAVTKKGNKTALHDAAERGRVETIELLLDYGADINRPANDNKSPLFFAAYAGHDAVVESLLKRGANPTIATVRGVTPAAIAKKGRHKELSARLIEAEKQYEASKVVWHYAV